MSTGNEESTNNVKVVLLNKNPNNYPTWLIFIQQYARIKYGRVGIIIESLKEKKPVKPTVPIPEEGQAEVNFYVKLEYQEKYKDYRKDKKEYKENKSKIFATIMYHMVRASHDMVKNFTGYEEADEKSDVISLMGIVRETHQAYAGLKDQARLTQLTRELILYKQAENQANASYCQKFREKINILVDAGLDLTIDANMKIYIQYFLQNLNKSLQGFVDQINDPTLSLVHLDTLEEAISLIERHDSYLQSRPAQRTTRPAQSTGEEHSTAVVATTTAQPSNKRKHKGRNGNKPAANGTQSTSSNTPSCEKCGRTGRYYRDCFCNPDNAAKKEQYFKSKRANNKRDSYKALVSLLENIVSKQN